MADDEVETFESSDAGSAHTYPLEAGQIRKGGHIMIKGNPCKVLDVPNPVEEWLRELPSPVLPSAAPRRGPASRPPRPAAAG